jgi:Type I restriction modification DNA specificity domain
MTRLRASDGIDPKFLAIQLHTLWARGFFRSLCTKHVNQASVSTQPLLDVEVAVPPLAEQRRIVAAIEEQFSRLDAADRSLAAAGERIGILEQAATANAFDGESPTSLLVDITPADRPICYGILMPKDHVEDGILYVRVKDFPRDRIHLSGLRRTAPAIAHKYRRSVLRPGDVLVSIRGTFGRVAIVPEELAGANITQDTARVTPGTEVDGRYVAAFLRSGHAQQFFRRVARGVAVKGVNLGDLRQLPVPVPPLEEQHRIVAEIEQELSLMDSLSTAVELARKRSAVIRRSILECAFRGGLVPQDSNDEPASVLLKRIRAERAAEPKPKRRKRVTA